MDTLETEKEAVRRRKRPLKTDMYLHPISAVEGFPVRKRRSKKYKLNKAVKMEGVKEGGLGHMTSKKTGGSQTDSSSEDEEYCSYTDIRRQQLSTLKSRMKCNPPKPVHTTVMRDLWADGESCILIPNTTHIPYSGKPLREKTFVNFTVCAYQRKFSP